MRHYTYSIAMKEIGRSQDWKKAKIVSLKKWREIRDYGEDHYGQDMLCGFCFVVQNRGVKIDPYDRHYGCTTICPASKICKKVTKHPIPASATMVIKELVKLKIKKKGK